MAERILLVQLADIGDLILTTPAIAALREARPDDHLTLLTSAHAAAIIPETLVDEIITIDRAQLNSSRAFFMPANLRRIAGIGQHDVVVFFHHFTLKLGTLKFWLIARLVRAKRCIGLQNGNGWFLTESLLDGGFGERHQAQYWLDLAGLLGADTAPHAAQVNTQSFVGLNPLDGLTVIIHPGSGGYSLARRWEPDKFAAVADALIRDHEARVVLVGGPDDDTAGVKAAMRHDVVDLTGKTTLAELASVISEADLFIGADSGVMHLASATGTPVIAIFGPSNHAAWGPWTPEGQSVVLRSGVACSPCSYVEHGIGLRDGCAARTCMKLVTPGQVIRAADQMLAGDVPASQPVASIPPSDKPWQRHHVLGLPVDGITYAQLLDQIAAWVDRDTGAHHICTTNPEFTMIAQQDPNFANILRRADLCVPDGIGMMLAAKRIGVRLPERVTGSDGVPIIAERAAQTGWKMFFLGAAPGIADQAADILRERYPGVQIVGTYSGNPSPDEEDQIVQMVNDSGADLLFVAYGAPKQDKWIARNLPRLQVSMAMGVGGTFDYIAGVVPRAPLWMRRLGLEWLYRLIREPWRIKRQVRLPRFVLAVMLRGET